MNRKALILGGGLAGCYTAYLLKKKNFDISIIEADKIGGLCRTRYYAGHPYEFGPHVFFWPETNINNSLIELTDVRQVQRHPISFINKDEKFYRYPIHYDDIKLMPESNEIKIQLKNRKGLPKIGECSFEEYFRSAVGEILYNKFMREYTFKMWGIPGNELQTSLVWADRVGKDANNYDPIKKGEDIGLANNMFQVYPKNGWNPVFDKMIENINIIYDTVVNIDKNFIKCKNHKLKINNYDTIIITISLDEILNYRFGELPYMGRILIPLIFDVEYLLPNHVESQHYSGNEFQTRVTEMKKITGHESNSTLILIEIPTKKTKDIFTENCLNTDNYFNRCYPVQSIEGLQLYKKYVEEIEKLSDKIKLVGRLASFRYWGMAETMKGCIELLETIG